MLSRLIVMRLPVNIRNMSNLPDSTYPQVTLALRLLRQRFNLCDASLPVIKRKTGRVFKNLFKLYLLDIRQAIMNSEWDFATKRLLPETGDFLKSFIKVQLMERAGYFYSKERLNLITFTQAWREYTNSVPDRLYLIIIYIVNITPKFIAKNYRYSKFLE